MREGKHKQEWTQSGVLLDMFLCMFLVQGLLNKHCMVTCAWFSWLSDPFDQMG